MPDEDEPAAGDGGGGDPAELGRLEHHPGPGREGDVLPGLCPDSQTSQQVGDYFT